MRVRSKLQFAVGQPRRRGGFTLLELMITIGIIAALIAILAPAISSARESARRVACLGNVRSLTAAILAYTAANDGVLPDAAGTNSFTSQICPLSQGKAAGSPIDGGFYVLPSIGALLQSYLASGADVWTCPSASVSTPVLVGDDPFSGYHAPNQFNPQYDYLSAKDLIGQAMFAKPFADQYKLRMWIARNVSGLRATRLTALGTNSRIVLIHDVDSSYHAKDKQSVYTYPADWDYYQNFGYLDGHAEGRAFHNVTEYLACIHGPIRQSWCGVDFTTAFPEQYAGY